MVIAFRKPNNNYNKPTQFVSRVSTELPPTNIEAEEAILGAILLDGKSIERVAKTLQPEHFSVYSHQLIYDACLQLFNANKAIDLLTVTALMTDLDTLNAIGGQGKIIELVETTVSSVNIDKYAEIVTEKFLRRELIRISHDLSELAYETDKVEIGDELHDVSNISSLMRIAENELKRITRNFLVTGKDSHSEDCYKLLEAIKNIELHEDNEAVKFYKMERLAKSNKMSIKTLYEIYFKSLIHREISPSMTLDEIIDKHGNDVKEWLLHGFIPKSTTILLHAMGGVGKTQLAYNFIYHLLTGEDWAMGDNKEIPFTVTAQSRRALIVQCDETPGDMINNLMDRGFNSSMPVRFITKWNINHVSYLREQIEKFQPEFVLIDSLTAINSRSIFSENDAEYARPLLVLRDLAEEYGCTFLIIHHSSKGGDARGTGAIFNSVSEVWKLSRPNDEAGNSPLDRTLTIEKSRSRRPTKYRLQYVPTDRSWVCLGEDGLEKAILPPEEGMSGKDMLIGFLSSNFYSEETPKNVFTVEELSRELGGNENTIRRNLAELFADKLINRRREKGGRAYVYFIQKDYESIKTVEVVAKEIETRPDDQVSPMVTDSVPDENVTPSPQDEDKRRELYEAIQREIYRCELRPGVELKRVFEDVGVEGGNRDNASVEQLIEVWTRLSQLPQVIKVGVKVLIKVEGEEKKHKKGTIISKGQLGEWLVLIGKSKREWVHETKMIRYLWGVGSYAYS